MLDDGRIERILGPKVREQAALRHPELFREPTDGQSLEPHARRERDRTVENGDPREGALARRGVGRACACAACPRK